MMQGPLVAQQEVCRVAVVRGSRATFRRWVMLLSLVNVADRAEDHVEVVVSALFGPRWPHSLPTWQPASAGTHRAQSSRIPNALAGSQFRHRRRKTFATTVAAGRR